MSFLERWSKNPLQASQEVPPKEPNYSKSLFSSVEIKDRKFVTIKDNFRKKSHCLESNPGESCNKLNSRMLLSASINNNGLVQFLGLDYISNIWDLDSFRVGSLPTAPWTGYYWPTFKGGIGFRYTDPDFPGSHLFKVNYESYSNQKVSPFSSQSIDLNKLSPAEKYDYLLGDQENRLTTSVWAEGKKLQDQYGSVPTWMGICHGWAPASIMEPEPKNSLTYKLDSNRGQLTLYAHDIKALISQVWAQAKTSNHYLGGRCTILNPPTDESGRIKNDDCFDVNPSEWHLALANLVGKKGLSFIFDATYDYEVWNQPIYRYKFNYFNPQTKKSGNLKESIIPYSSMEKDIFSKYRSKNVMYLVGVISEVHYVIEEFPDTRNSGTSLLKSTIKVSYHYDLELDQNYNVIGGEWYQAAHPDMLWRPQTSLKPEYPGEDNLTDWDGHFPIKSEYLSLSKSLSPKSSPISKLIRKLIEHSSL